MVKEALKIHIKESDNKIVFSKSYLREKVIAAIITLPVASLLVFLGTAENSDRLTIDPGLQSAGLPLGLLLLVSIVILIFFGFQINAGIDHLNNTITLFNRRFIFNTSERHLKYDDIRELVLDKEIKIVSSGESGSKIEQSWIAFALLENKNKVEIWKDKRGHNTWIVSTALAKHARKDITDSSGLKEVIRDHRNLDGHYFQNSELAGDISFADLEEQFKGKIERKPGRIVISEFGSIPQNAQVWVFIIFGLAAAIVAIWFYLSFFAPAVTIVIIEPTYFMNFFIGAMIALIFAGACLISIYTLGLGVYNALGGEEVIVIENDRLSNGWKLRGVVLRGRTVTTRKIIDLRVGRKGGIKKKRLVTDIPTVEVLSPGRILAIGNFNSVEMADSVRLLIISLFSTGPSFV